MFSAQDQVIEEPSYGFAFLVAVRTGFHVEFFIH